MFDTDDSKEKFYVPIKLNRSSMIGPYSLVDAAVLFMIAIPTVMLLVSTKSALCLLPVLTYAVMRLRFGERTVGSKVKKIIKQLSSSQLYLLKECTINNENI